MVNKMSLKFIFFIFGCIIFANSAAAQTNSAIQAIKDRGFVVCGISKEYPYLAYREEDVWQGFDADICRALSQAVFNNSELFKLVPVSKQNIGQTLNTGLIDIMLGHQVLSSSEELSQNITPVTTLYYDRQMFASRSKTKATSMRDFKDSKICVVSDSITKSSLIEYNQKNALNFKIMDVPSLFKLKETFFINRCELITADETFLKGVIKEIKTSEEIDILPEEIAYIPVKAYTAGNNNLLNITFQWIFNALRLAESYTINSHNIDSFSLSQSPNIQRLLGVDPRTWNKLNLHPDWAKQYIYTFGNYEQIFERTLGSNSKFKLDASLNRAVENGGIYMPHLFF